ncbi:MAG: HAD family hydrolase [Thermoplasmata archaeon]
MIVFTGLEWIVFDVDGVLVDVSESYDEVVRRTVDHWLDICGCDYELSLETVRELRVKGEFPDDYKLSEALIIEGLSGGSLDDIGERFPRGEDIGWFKERSETSIREKKVQEVFDSYYFGGKEEGLWKKETPSVDVELLIRLKESEDYKLGVVTSRSEEELQMAESILGFEFENRVTREVARKPDPRALKYITLDEKGVYIGDTNVDRSLVENYNDIGGDFEFVMVGEDISDLNDFLKNLF